LTGGKIAGSPELSVIGAWSRSTGGGEGSESLTGGSGSLWTASMTAASRRSG